MITVRSFGRSFTVTVTLASLILLAGCPTMPLQSAAAPKGSTVPLSTAEQQLLDDEKRFNATVFAGVVTGAVAGGLLGGIAAWAAGGDKKEIRNTAVGGAVAGAALVGVDAYVNAKKEQAGRQKVRATEAVAADMQKDNARLRAYLATSDQVLGEGKARLQSLRADLASKKLSADQAQQSLAREERNIESMKKTLAEAKSTRQQYATASTQLPDTPQNKRNLDTEIAGMDAQIKKLEQNIGEYGRALAVSRA